jgi:hypothetical protein
MAKMMRITFVLGFALSLGTAATWEAPPSPHLPYSAVGEYDFRGCDRDWNHVNDFWTSNPSDLYRMTTLAAPEADFRACDRDWNTPVPVSTSKDPEE